MKNIMWTLFVASIFLSGCASIDNSETLDQLGHVGAGTYSPLGDAHAGNSPILKGSVAERMTENDSANLADLSSPPIEDGYKLVPFADASDKCGSSIRYRIIDTNSHGVEAGNERFLTALKKIGDQLALSCPSLQQLRLFSDNRQQFAPGRANNAFSRSEDWRSNGDVRALTNRAWEAQSQFLKVYKSRPKPTVSTPNPLESYGFYASELIAESRGIRFYRAFANEQQYYKEALIVALHSNIQTQVALELENDEPYFVLSRNYAEWINGVLSSSGVRYYHPTIFHYIEGIVGPSVLASLTRVCIGSFPCDSPASYPVLYTTFDTVEPWTHASWYEYRRGGGAYFIPVPFRGVGEPLQAGTPKNFYEHTVKKFFDKTVLPGATLVITVGDLLGIYSDNVRQRLTTSINR